MKKIISLLLMAVIVLTLFSACNNPGSPASGVNTAAVDDDENYTTGDASLDDPKNGDDIGENELLVVSFGTSFNDSRRLTIGAIEDTLAKNYPDWSVRRAFTSQIIIDHISKRDGIKIDNVEQALKRAADNGVKRLVVQPTHIMDGFEYNDLLDEVAKYSDAFEKVSVGKPLLSSDDDYTEVMNVITAATAEYDDGTTAIVFMGHGTEADSNSVYSKMQQLLADNGHDNYYIGTVEAAPGVEDVVAAIKDKGYKKVVLEPLMIVAGDHANNDMAGDDEDSWKSVFTKEGYDVECLLRGLGEIEGIRNLISAHASDAIASAAK